MTSQKKGPTSKSARTGSGMLGDQVVAWAQRKFGTDFDRAESIRALQERLTKLGHRVFADGVMGPSTLKALQAQQAEDAGSQDTAEVLADQAQQEPPDIQMKAEPGSFTLSGGEATFRTSNLDAEEGETEVAEEQSRQEEQQTQTDEEGLSAQPVALSDSAIESVDKDKLGFGPYVVAVARFLLAEQTRPPLALAINAPWGRGKTSFMNMIDGELHATAETTGVRVATTRFNPWKYSEAEQVWAAFVGNVARCIRDHLTPEQRFRFWLSRLWAKIRRNADFGLVVRVLVAVVFLSLLGLMFALDWAGILKVLKKDYLVLEVFMTALARSDSGGVAGWLAYLTLVLASLLAVAALYIGFAKKLGLNLLDYLEKTDFKDKIGTLSQFEGEMRRLTEAIPPNMKVVVFVDDLDRCKGPVLGEIVEALQLADVSKSCIFVLGMDLNIVANVIERERQELAQSVDSGNGKLEHGSGYKFLEKIIQARLSLPDYGPEEMAELIASAMQPDRAVGAGLEGAKPDFQKDGATRLPVDDEQGVAESGLDQNGSPDPAPVIEQIRDSSLVIRLATHYGSGHFENPRRLKRFINGFRLQTYLAASNRTDAEQVDRLARLLVLAEKWPALLEQAIRNEEVLDDCQAFLRGEDLKTGGRKGTMQTHVETFGLRGLSEADRERLAELLLGTDGQDPFGFGNLKELAEWYGFCYYPGIVKAEP